MSTKIQTPIINEPIMITDSFGNVTYKMLPSNLIPQLKQKFGGELSEFTPAIKEEDLNKWLTSLEDKPKQPPALI